MKAHTEFDGRNYRHRLEREHWTELLFFIVADAFVDHRKWPSRLILANEWFPRLYVPVPMRHYWITRSHYAIIFPLAPLYWLYSWTPRLWFMLAAKVQRAGFIDLDKVKEGAEPSWFWPKYLSLKKRGTGPLPLEGKELVQKVVDTAKGKE